MSQPFNIQNDTVVITKLDVTEITSPVTASGPITVNELTGKTITVDTLSVKNLIKDGNPTSEIGSWITNTEAQLNGKGFNWAYGEGEVILQYRTGAKLWTNGHLDLEATKSYKIDGVSVLSKNELGPQITKSKLRELGPLTQLHVLGETSIGEFAYFKSNFQRLGINTPTPNGALSVVDNGIEIVVGSQQIGKAYVGTHTNHDLVIGTDNQARVTVRNNGEIIFGDEQAKSSVVRIYGELVVEKITTDTRTDTISPVTFNATRGGSIYGLGLVWSSAGEEKKLVMKDSPDRLYSSESLEIAEGKCLYIDGKPALTSESLGSSIVTSNLNKVGTLQDLTVSGKTTLLGDVEANVGRLQTKVLSFNDGSQTTSIDNYKLNTSNQYTISVRNQDAIYVDTTEIALGNSSNPKRPVKVFGQLTVGVNTPDPRVALAVNGNAQLSGRMFGSGTSAPANGIYNKGDIVWNDNPAPASYIGWVCVVAGEPGVWMPFGNIASQ